MGTYSYKDNDGSLVSVSYTSDEHGFVPTGSVIHPSIIKNAETVSHNVDEEEMEMHEDKDKH